jgi:hypothetical protein
VTNTGVRSALRRDAWYGYVRHPDGRFSIFAVPNSGHGSGQGTLVYGVNSSGEVTGYYNGKAGYAHGFLREAQGNFTSFDAPGSDFTLPVAINCNGEVVGYYTNLRTFGFVRDAAGNLSSFEAADAISTFPYGMNDEGAIVGKWRTQDYVDFGFELEPGVGIREFSAMPSDSTTAIAINNVGQITGYYVDSSGAYHGWFRSNKEARP